MTSISALFGPGNQWANLLTARSRIPGAVAARPTAEAVKEAIGSATRLDKSSRQTLTSLTDTVSKFAGGDPKLMRDIMSISNLMQFGGKEQPLTGSSPYAALLTSHYASHFKIDA